MGGPTRNRDHKRMAHRYFIFTRIGRAIVVASIGRNAACVTMGVELNPATLAEMEGGMAPSMIVLWLSRRPLA